MLNKLLIIRGYNRPYYLKEVLDALEKCIGIEDIDIYIHIDAHKDTRPQTKEVISEFKYQDRLTTKIHVNKQGCAGSQIFALKYCFDHNDYDAVINLEDDFLPSIDTLRWTTWALEYSKNREDIYTICLGTRAVSGGNDPRNQPPGCVIKDGFDCGFGVALHRRTWEDMKSKGGLFGVDGPCAVDGLSPEEWRHQKGMTEHGNGSWAWPVKKYFAYGKNHLFPNLSRCNNIGALEGRFNPSVEYHKQYIRLDRWAGSDEFKDVDWANLEYQDPNGDIIKGDSGGAGPCKGW